MQAYRAITMFKEEYLLDFINTEELFIRDKDRNERVIEQRIVQNVKDILVLQNRHERERKQIKRKILNINHIYVLLKFPILSELALKKI